MKYLLEEANILMEKGLGDKVDSLSPMEKFRVINDFLIIRIKSGVRYFLSDADS